MSTSTYNLIDEPWIPVQWHPEAPLPDSGMYPDRVGLRELLLRSNDIAGLAIADAPAHSALLRILYALTARVTKLDEAGPGNWDDRRADVLEQEELLAEDIDAYFGKFRSRFFLYDPEGGRPWMQDPRLAEQCDAENTAGVNKLIVTRASGNNHAWWRHGSDSAPDLPGAPEAVLSMLVWHYYGPSGRCSAREVGGVKSASATAGPLRTALSYHPEGDSLFTTLLAGLMRPEHIVRRTSDQCPWEWDELRNPDAVPPAPSGPCSRLTACSQHALLLVPEGDDGKLVADAFITWAYRSGRIPRNDDFLIWQISQQGNPYPRPADSSRALWRDLDALLLKDAAEAQPQSPKVFATAGDVLADLRVRALGFDQDGQAKDTQFIDSTTPVVLGLVEVNAPRTQQPVSRLRQFGELYGYRLQRAVKQAWTEYTGDTKTGGGAWAAEAAARYWPHAEAEFWGRFRQLDRTGTDLSANFDAAGTRRAFLRLAEEAYEAVTAPATSTLRGAKAVVGARVELYGGIRKSKKKDTGGSAAATRKESTG